MTPSYSQSTATLRCIKGYVAIEPGSAVCGSDGEWIIDYPECEGILYNIYVCMCVYMYVCIYKCCKKIKFKKEVGIAIIS